jgi:hypothetical protein
MNSQTIPNCGDRIRELVVKNLGDAGSYGLELVGWDIALGNWVVNTPAGPQPLFGYALMIAAKGKGPGGAVIIGQQTFVQNMDVLPGPLPTEDTIKTSIQGSYDSLRTLLAQQRAGDNGQQLT